MEELLSNKLIIEDENGNKTTYEVLLLFKSFSNGKKYVVYTDNKKENNKLNVYVKTYTDDGIIEEIMDDSEWYEIERRIKELFEVYNNER